MGTLFHVILVQPLLNALVFLYTYNPIQDFGIAIILLTVLIRLILLPLSLRATASQQKMAKLQPHIKEIQEKYKNDKETQARKTMELWKEHRVNPASGCLPLLIQLPVLFALFRVFNTDFSSASFGEDLYSFTPHPGHFSLSFFGLDLTRPNFILAILAGAGQYVQTKLIIQPPAITQEGEMAKILQQQQLVLMYVMPLLTIWIAWRFPAGLALYWVTTSLLTIVQQWWVARRLAAAASQ